MGPGAGAIDQVYACSGSLNGEAVLVFVRALCAVSQEELNPPHPTDIPRWACPLCACELVCCWLAGLGSLSLVTAAHQAVWFAAKLSAAVCCAVLAQQVPCVMPSLESPAAKFSSLSV